MSELTRSVVVIYPTDSPKPERFSVLELLKDSKKFSLQSDDVCRFCLSFGFEYACKQ